MKAQPESLEARAETLEHAFAPELCPVEERQAVGTSAKRFLARWRARCGPGDVAQVRTWVRLQLYELRDEYGADRMPAKDMP